MSRLSTKQRRASVRREKDEKLLERLNKVGLGDYYDPWGRPCGLGTWAKWFESDGPERFLATTVLENGYRVSTVWLGTDLGFSFLGGERRPLIYETGVFRPKPGPERFSSLGSMLDCDRYATRREAKAGHRKMVETWSKRPKLEVVG